MKNLEVFLQILSDHTGGPRGPSAAHLTTIQRPQGVLQDNNPDGLLEKIW
jgi:hypothetical protein